MHAATDCHHHRPLAQDGASDSGTLSRADARARRAGDLQFRELTANKVCKPTANRRRYANASEKEKIMHNNKLAGAPGRIRTSDPQIRSLVLYPAELRALVAHRAGNAPGSAKAGGNGPFPIGFPPHWQVLPPFTVPWGPLAPHAEERPKAASRSNAGRRSAPCALNVPVSGKPEIGGRPILRDARGARSSG